MEVNFKAAKGKVLNRGVAPDSFLEEVIAWAKTAPDEVFAPNPSKIDIYASIKAALGPWENLQHRKAAMIEVMRVHAGFESSWKWSTGVDTTNKTSMRNIEGQETGIFQVSFDSTYLGGGAMKPYVKEHGIDTPQTFIPAMKKDHRLAIDYYARLIRVSTKWAGPILRHEIDKWLSRDAVREFEVALAA
jgi:hypothetical protein